MDFLKVNCFGKSKDVVTQLKLYIFDVCVRDYNKNSDTELNELLERLPDELRIDFLKIEDREGVRPINKAALNGAF